MQIKIKKNVVHGGKLHKKDSVVDLPAKDARYLLEKEFATDESSEPKQQQQQQQQQP